MQKRVAGEAIGGFVGLRRVGRREFSCLSENRAQSAKSVTSPEGACRDGGELGNVGLVERI